MPYIDRGRRAVIDAGTGHPPLSPGELNYAITRLLIDYHDGPGMGLGYQAINDCLGALEGAKLEFYRRKVVPYEAVKRHENGDVY